MIAVRGANFTEGSNYFAAVQEILLILGEVDVFLFTNGVYNVARKFLSFCLGPGLVIFLPTCKYFENQIDLNKYAILVHTVEDGEHMQKSI